MRKFRGGTVAGLSEGQISHTCETTRGSQIISHTMQNFAWYAKSSYAPTPLVFRYSHGFHLWPILARIQLFSGTHTHSTIFPNWSGQFFFTRTDSTFCRYWPGCNNFPVLALILPFFRTGPDSFRYTKEFHLFPVLDRIQQFFGTHTDSTIFPY